MTTTNFFARSAAVIAGAGLVAASFASFATTARAAALSSTQISAIISLLQSFGADAATVANVSASLNGTAPVASAPSMSSAFSKVLTVGSTGADVTALQNFLISKGYTIAAGATGTFGPQTKAALAAYQSAKGISPAVGYFGPLTMASVNSMMSTTPSNPSNPSTPSSPVSLNGTAGTITTTASTGDNTDTVRTGTSETVLGFKVQADGSDVNVNNVRVRFTKAGTASASDLLTNYANSISVSANGTKVGSLAASDFTRESAGVYSANIPVSSVVKMGTSNKATFAVGLMANSTIDTDDLGGTWTAELVWVRYSDATGALFADSPDAITNAGIVVERLSSSSDVKLQISEGSNNPSASNVEVSEDNTTSVTLAEFTLKAAATDMNFDTLVASTTVTGSTATSSMISALYLMQGSKTLATVDVSDISAYNATFNLDDLYTLAADTTTTFKIVAKVNKIDADSADGAIFDQGDSMSVAVSGATYAINAKAADGKSVTTRSGSVTTYTQTFYSKGIKLAFSNSSSTVTNDTTTAANSSASFDANVTVTAFGADDVYVPLNAVASSTAVTSDTSNTKGITYYLTGPGSGGSATTTGSATVERVSGGTIVTVSGIDLVKIGGGSSATIHLKAYFNPSAPASNAGSYRLSVIGVGYRSDASAAVTTSRVVATPATDFVGGWSNTIND